MTLDLGSYLMSRRRFFAPPSAFDFNSRTVWLAADEARHLRDVLRLQPGDEVYVFDGAGKEFQCRITSSDRNRAELGIVAETEPAKAESPLEITLGVALLKGEKFDLVVQKATELGVTRVVPLVTKHADIRLRDASDAAKRVARWQRIALEAAKQSGRAAVPEVTAPVDFDSFIQQESGDPTETRLMFSERDGESLNAPSASSNLKALIALIGSEGGWADEEITGARTAGWRIVTLGGRILRAETAAIAVATLLQHRFGDLG